jgi:hypothetical protein
MTLGLGWLGAAACGRRQAPDDFRFGLNHFGGIRAGNAFGGDRTGVRGGSA